MKNKIITNDKEHGLRINNGYHLDFADSSDLGKDTSGNGNDFTLNNITSVDQVSIARLTE